MKKLLFLPCFSLLLWAACKQSEPLNQTLPDTPQNSISFTVTNTATGQTDVVEDAEVSAVFFHNAYPVLNKPGERDVIFNLQPEVPTGTAAVTRFTFSFLFSTPEELLDIVDSNILIPALLKDPADYPLLLLDDDPENGQRVCLTKENTDSNGTTAILNACAAEGWYGEDGSFTFNYTHHELFFDDDNMPHIFATGTFEAETHPFLNSPGKFELSDGSFQVVIPLILQ